MVQGVGFRPFVYSLALSLGLRGTVYNDSSGVFITVQGDSEAIEIFLVRLKNEAPPLSKISSIVIESLILDCLDDFSILPSRSCSGEGAFLPPDVAICQECKSELSDPKNRRYGYALTNCTNCGPRYTIISSLPYDRANTSMKVFEMCADCRREYENPLDRRFHAEPISCPNCGPKLFLTDNTAKDLCSTNPAQDAAALINAGKIVAIKGLGGFHLVCNASDREAVSRLRERKRRAKKPLAVMFRDENEIKKHCLLNASESEILNSSNAPILLLQKSENYALPENLSFGTQFLGCFLPYTPLQVTLFENLDSPIVATSANISDEPIITTRDELVAKLFNVVDYILDFDREILNGCDDSVVRNFDGDNIKLRVARGYAPSNFDLKYAFSRSTLCVGAQQKSTISLGFDKKIVTSAYIGDLFGIDSVEKYKKTVQNLSNLYNFTPKVVVCDKNSAYESSKYAEELGIDRLYLQHHKAHLFAALYENALLETAVLGVVFDGTGFGDDGTIWGGEFFLYDTKSCNRVKSLNGSLMLGGEIAAKEPRRSALSRLYDIYGEEANTLDNATIRSFSTMELDIFYKMYKGGSNSIYASSAGRLFDAVASYFGLLQKDCYDGEAGLLIESLYDERIADRYEIVSSDGKIDFPELFMNSDSASKGVSKFINTLSAAIAEEASYYGLPVVLSGGVFQNVALCRAVKNELTRRGIKCFFHKELSPNDSSISVGQAVYANLHQNGKII